MITFFPIYIFVSIFSPSGSPAELAGLRTGDRVIEVDGTNIERETHTQVVARIKAGGGSTSLLVVDRELDAYCRRNGITIKESMAERGEQESPRLNGDHLEVQGEVHIMNGDAKDMMGDHDVIEVNVEAQEESAPDRQTEIEEEHQYSEIQRREEEEEVVEEQSAEVEDEERREVEDEVVQAEEVNVEESIPVPPMDRDEEPEVNIPEPEPEPILEAATVPDVESAPPIDDETDTPAFIEEPERQPTPEPVREPSPEPVREPTPEPVREPTPEPVREPTPEPVREPTPEPVREPTPEPVREPTPEPEPKPSHQPTRVQGSTQDATLAAVQSESMPPARPAAPPTTRQASLNIDSNKSGLELSTMEKARILAAGRKKKKQASAKNWEDKFAAFNNL
ncbi:protein TsetseEP-like isoform X1 [Lytechinus variegatus]|uniref:protein TsetseEP-like isoform X1 n=1 Tax=Lytechinus variegatus TaxID=7654 RepID=UPI001BB24070|nr:protein TsetseEP-like isoform X1 [Lytechinus variegatus]